ncbi:MAG: diguanylate cyclase domain-containing protein [Clostridiaceae bacterium]
MGDNKLTSRDCTDDKISAINELIEKLRKYEEVDFDKSKEYAEMAKKLSQNIHYEQGIAIADLYIAKAYRNQGKLEKAIFLAFENLSSLKKLNLVDYEAECLNTIGTIYFYFKNYEIAISYFLNAKDLSEKFENMNAQAVALNNIGEIYRILMYFEKAEKYYAESLNIRLEYDIQGICVNYLNLAEVSYYSEDHNKALKYIEKAYESAKSSNYNSVMPEVLEYIGLIYIKMNNIKDGESFIKQSIIWANNNKDKFTKIDILIKYSRFLLEYDRVEEGINFLKEALEISQNVNDYISISDITSILSDFYLSIDDKDQALEYFKKHSMVNKEILLANKKQVSFNMNTQLEIEKTLQKNEELREKSKALEEYNARIKIIKDIGKTITSIGEIEEIVTTCYENINKLVDAGIFGIALLSSDYKNINYSCFIEDGERKKLPLISINSQNSIAAYAIRNDKTVVINDIDEVYDIYFNMDSEKINSSNLFSIIYVPLKVDNKIIGIITVQSKKKNAYSSYHVETLESIGAYAAIAIKNAQKSKMLQAEITKRIEIQAQLEMANSKLKNLSDIDGLTKIPNRRRFDEFIEKEWTRSVENKELLSLILIDIDNFKKHNDNYGHVQGDKCLKIVANILKSAVTKTSYFVARYGGDEFIIVLPNTSIKEGNNFAELLRIKVEGLKNLKEQKTMKQNITISQGIASVVPNQYMNINFLIKKADEALYNAKNQGKNKVSRI